MFGNSLSFTLYDIIGHIMPGAVVVLFIVWQYNLDLSANSTLLSTALLTTSYITGHLLHTLGSWLFTGIYKENFENTPWLRSTINFLDSTVRAYQSLLLTSVPTTEYKMKEQIRELIKKKLNMTQKLNSLMLYDLCCNITLKAGYSEKSVIEAKEGFYRALVPAIPVCYFVLVTKNELADTSIVGISLAAILTIELLRNRREYYRRIRNNQIYSIALLELEEMKK